ncbi:hydroxycinnamoyltransferase 1 [Nicotiana tabacum]|uniref:Protein ECERIFERUM 1-like n=1 Tax=Nicotiana sylvestris TaxID=4096 RepID=A0A1U7XIW0_NICSY|nr:PREDICTED: protein ECERIFERUM 1-like [Nicotiana sylvestris]
MATCNGNGAAKFSSKLQVEAIQTVIPMKITDPRLSRRISVSEKFCSGDLQRRFHMVLYYNKASETDSGWIVAGWFKESLGMAIVESPLFGGRLRKLEDNNDLELVSNDSGVRLVEANVEINMADFIDLKNKENIETEFVFWEDIHETSPQFSPLFYVQVTNFKCGGYSIGISCSLFLADPFVMTNFLKNWSKIHNKLISQIDAPKIPAFYTPNLRKVGFLPTISTSLTTRNQTTQTQIFKIPKTPLNLNNNFLKNYAAKCIGEIEEKIGKKLSSKFTLFVKESTNSENVIKVETCNKEEIIKEECGLLSKNGGLISISWDDLGGDKVSFNEGNKAVNMSCWIINAENQDLVMITPSLDEDSSQLNIIITVTN